MPIGDAALMYWGLILLALSIPVLAGLSFLPARPLVKALSYAATTVMLAGFGLKVLYLWQAINIVFDDPTTSPEMRRDSAVTTTVCMIGYLVLAVVTTRYFAPTRRHRTPSPLAWNEDHPEPENAAGRPTSHG